MATLPDVTHINDANVSAELMCRSSPVAAELILLDQGQRPGRFYHSNVDRRVGARGGIDSLFHDSGYFVPSEIAGGHGLKRKKKSMILVFKKEKEKI